VKNDDLLQYTCWLVANSLRNIVKHVCWHEIVPEVAKKCSRTAKIGPESGLARHFSGSGTGFTLVGHTKPEKTGKTEKSRKNTKKPKKHEKDVFPSERPFLEIGFPGPQTFCGHSTRVYRKKWSIGAPSENTVFRVFRVFSVFSEKHEKCAPEPILGPPEPQE